MNTDVEKIRPFLRPGVPKRYRIAGISMVNKNNKKYSPIVNQIDSFSIIPWFHKLSKMLISNNTYMITEDISKIEINKPMKIE